MWFLWDRIFPKVVKTFEVCSRFFVLNNLGIKVESRKSNFGEHKKLDGKPLDKAW